MLIANIFYIEFGKCILRQGGETNAEKQYYKGQESFHAGI